MSLEEEAQQAFGPCAVKAEPDLEPLKPANNDVKQSMYNGDDDGTDYLEQLISETNPEVLEGGVKIGLQVLAGMKTSLEPSLHTDDPEAPHWMKTIQELEKQAQPARTVVGVVGNTGAGKSSVINALLDEEKLLPTNGLRACTACPSEVSWNYSEDPNELYRAEVEFITVEDWRSELKVIMDDLLNDNGEVSNDCTNGDSEAGLAYAKIKAVYPHMTKEDMSRTTVEKLVEWTAMRKVLGSIKTMRERSSDSLYTGLKRYVDSKEKTVAGARGLPKKDAEMEYWPLIKVVRIYTKSRALETGAIIVDLPGVHDSNAARAAVAARYMQICTGLWIVADITRAVDDKTAKSLLGDSFKRQLKYDGTYSTVTFICSKTDNISETEATESLPHIAFECAELWNNMVELDQQFKSLQAKVGVLKDEQVAIEYLQDELDTKFDDWQDLQEKLADVLSVYAPRPSPNPLSKKRKRQGQSSSSRKARVAADADDDDAPDQDDLDEENDKENGQPSQEDREPLTAEQIEETLASIKEEKKRLRLKRRETGNQITAIKNQMNEVDALKAGLGGQRKSICIKGRNEYSRGAIKYDFSAGIKELDQEAAQEEDEDNFNPDATDSLRDYEEVAKSLPVFCVSSRAYQSICGRLQKDEARFDGFLEAAETEIPQLQDHARKLTEAGRARSCRAFLNDLNQLINSMKLWATMDGSRSLSGRERETGARILGPLLEELDMASTAFELALETIAEGCVSEIKAALAVKLCDTFERLIPAASEASVTTASGWGAHRSLGGLSWSTYKATVRRRGIYSGAAGPRDFNDALFEPISKKLSTPWDKAFQRRIPLAFDVFQKKTQAALGAFHQRAVATAAERSSTNYAGLSTLTQQLRSYSQAIACSPDKLRQLITEMQKDASRAFTPSIQESMDYAYVACTEERGTGSYARMKQAMINHVETSRHTMFSTATALVKGQIVLMCKEVNDTLLEVIEEIFQRVSRDYSTVLLGVSEDSQAMLRAEKALRLEMTKLLSAADSAFRPLVLVEVEQTDVAAPRHDTPTLPSESHLEQDVATNILSDVGDADELIAVQLNDTLETYSTIGVVKSEPE